MATPLLPARGSESTPTTGRLFLVRHGESGWNAERRVQGQAVGAPGLTARGRGQALALARELTGTLSTDAAVVTSDLARAVETGAILATELQLDRHTDASLREQSFGELEGRRHFDLVHGKPVEDIVAGLWADPDRHPAGGESVLAMWRRFQRGLDRIGAAFAGDVVVVCHGGPMRVAATLQNGRALGSGPRPTVANGAVVEYSMLSGLRA
jgi:probable phosphoglycerate mutase